MVNVLNIYQHNTHSLVCVVTGLSDFTGYVPYMSVKHSAQDPSTVMFKDGVLNDASGTFIFTLNEIDTSLNWGPYVYDVTLINPDASKKYTIAKSTLNVLETCID